MLKKKHLYNFTWVYIFILPRQFSGSDPTSPSWVWTVTNPSWGLSTCATTSPIWTYALLPIIFLAFSTLHLHFIPSIFPISADTFGLPTFFLRGGGAGHCSYNSKNKNYIKNIFCWYSNRPQHKLSVSLSDLDRIEASYNDHNHLFWVVVHLVLLLLHKTSLKVTHLLRNGQVDYWIDGSFSPSVSHLPLQPALNGPL